jgi:hypothetical protein
MKNKCSGNEIGDIYFFTAKKQRSARVCTDGFE